MNTFISVTKEGNIIKFLEGPVTARTFEKTKYGYKIGGKVLVTFAQLNTMYKYATELEEHGENTI